jgi:hypothetical protein
MAPCGRNQPGRRQTFRGWQRHGLTRTLLACLRSESARWQGTPVLAGMRLLLSGLQHSDGDHPLFKDDRTQGLTEPL